MLKKILIVIGALVALFVVVGLLLPQTYGMSRDTTVDAPIAVVFDQVNDLTKNEAWSPWMAADPTMKVTYGDIRSGVGATYSWTSENMGSGSLTVAKVDPPNEIVNTLAFDGQGEGKGIWKFEQAGDSVKVTWSMEGQATGIADRYFGLFIDSMVGGQFETGLANLKRVSEAVPTSTTTATL